ncbi:MAG: leucine-rich repeat domain-containing protein [Acutalibacteraceae bacterium]
MIIIQNGQFIVPKCERKIGFTGDNAHKTVRFFISDSTQGEWFYRIYLKFDDGTVNYFIPDSTKTNDGTEIIWEVKDEHIFKGGIVTLQIKAFNNTGEVYHTNATHLIVGDTIEFGDCFSEKQNAEFLEYEKRLNEILKQIVTEQSKLPYIGSNKNWFVYDRSTGEFVDTRVRAEGENAVEDFSVTTDKLANGSVTGYRLYGSDNANSKIARETITGGNTGNIAKNTISDYNLADGAVTISKLGEDVFEEFNGRYQNIEFISEVSELYTLDGFTDKSKIYLIYSFVPPFSADFGVSTGSTYGYLHWVGEMQKLTLIDGIGNAVKTFTRRCQRGEGSQASIIVGWSNFEEAINSYGAVNLGEVNALSTLNGCTDTQKTYFFKVGNSLQGEFEYMTSNAFGILNCYKTSENKYMQTVKIIGGVEFTYKRTYDSEQGSWSYFTYVSDGGYYELDGKINTLDRFFTADIAQLNSDVLDNAEAITQNTADIEELKVKTLSSVNLTLPSVIQKIPDLAFCANTDIISVTISYGTASIGYSAFQDCQNLAVVTIPNSLTSINGCAFKNCKSLTNISLPNSITSIGFEAFQGCTGLASITIPNSVTTVGSNVFKNCKNLTSVTLEDGFNANGLNLSESTKYTAETIVSWLNALADRTEQEQYTLKIGAVNKAKLTAEQLATATNKNWNIA